MTRLPLRPVLPAFVLVLTLLVAGGVMAAQYERPGPAQDASGELVDDQWLYRAKPLVPHQYVDLNAGNSVQRVVPDDGFTSQPIMLNHGSGAPFVFDFYGSPIDRLFIHGEGFVSSVPDAGYTPIADTDPVPEIDAPGNPILMMAPFWSNWDISDCGGEVRTGVFINPGLDKRVFIVDWSRMVHESQAAQCTGGSGFPAYHSFQLQIYEETNVIAFSYGYAQSEYLAPGAGANVTVGVLHQDPEWSDGRDEPLHLQWGSCTCPDTRMTSRSIRFFPNHEPAPKPIIRDMDEDGGTEVFYLAGTDQDGDSIIAYRISNGTDTLEQPGGGVMQLDKGMLDCDDAPKCVYTPFEHRYGKDSFAYAAKDRILLDSGSGCPAPPNPCSVSGAFGPESTVTIDLLAVNDPPAFTIPDPALMPQTGEIQSLAGWVQDIRTGPETDSGGAPVPAPYNESTQTIISFEVSVSDPSLFVALPQVSPTGDLQFKAKPGRCGAVDTFVRATDSGGSTNGGKDRSTFIQQQLVVECFSNDPPFLHEGLNQTLHLDQGDFKLLNPTNFPLRDDHHWPGAPEHIGITLLDVPEVGALWVGGAPLEPGEAFTMADVVDGRVGYQSDGIGHGPDIVRVNATDAFGAYGIEELWLQVAPVTNPPPVALRVLGVQVTENETVVLDATRLAYHDGVGSADVDVRLIIETPPTQGRILRGGLEVSHFTQHELNTGSIRYHNEGGPAGMDGFTFRVRDLDGAITSPRDFPITILPPDHAPVPAGDIVDRVVRIGESVSFVARATDLEDDAYTCSVSGEVPTGATLDAESCQFRFRPSTRQVGTYQLTITFTESIAPVRESSKSFTIRVVPLPDTTRPLADSDRDGIPDGHDNCPFRPNHGQLDLDRNGIGDACQVGKVDYTPGAPSQYASLEQADFYFPDEDEDGIADAKDNCADDANHGQEDLDADGVGDACDFDYDGDGVPEQGGTVVDNCPDLANPDQQDSDGNGLGDACDPDRDGDGVPQQPDEGPADNCPDHANPEQNDTDADGRGDVCQALLEAQPQNDEPEPLDGTETQSAAAPYLWALAGTGALAVLSLAGFVTWRTLRRKNP